MAYTHSWEITNQRIDREQWDLMCEAAEFVFERVRRDSNIKLVYGYDRTSAPVTNQSAIRCNGHPALGQAGEDMIIRRTGRSSCTTGDSYADRLPYDLAVVAVLNACGIISKDFVWRSDGDASQLAEGMALGQLAADHAMRAQRSGTLPAAKTEQESEHQTPPVATGNGAVNQDQLQAAMSALAAAFGAGQVDESKVREIVQAELADFAAPTRVEIVAADGSTRTMPEASHKVFPDVLRFLANDINVMLVGPAGSGKTTLAMQAAEALERSFYMTGAILQKYELLGFIDANGNYIRSTFREAYEHGGVFLWDEMDSSNPAALVAFHAALENGHADFPDGQVTRHDSFVCIGAANTYGHGATREYIGRNALDGATLDRYAVITMDYDPALESALAGNAEFVREIQAYREAAAKLGIKHIISPRASIRGARMLKAGMDKHAVLDALVWKGLPADKVSKIQTEAGYQPTKF